MDGRWMANEDLNIWMYVRQFGTGRHKKQEFWAQGYEKKFWRSSKTHGALRSRYRFYVKHLTQEDTKSIIKNIKTGKTHYINFANADPDGKSTGARRMVSILTDPTL